MSFFALIVSMPWGISCLLFPLSVSCSHVTPLGLFHVRLELGVRTELGDCYAQNVRKVLSSTRDRTLLRPSFRYFDSALALAERRFSVNLCGVHGKKSSSRRCRGAVGRLVGWVGLGFGLD